MVLLLEQVGRSVDGALLLDGLDLLIAKEVLVLLELLYQTPDGMRLARAAASFNDDVQRDLVKVADFLGKEEVFDQVVDFHHHLVIAVLVEVAFHRVIPSSLYVVSLVPTHQLF